MPFGIHSDQHSHFRYLYRYPIASGAKRTRYANLDCTSRFLWGTRSFFDPSTFQIQCYSMYSSSILFPIRSHPNIALPTGFHTHPPSISTAAHWSHGQSKGVITCYGKSISNSIR